MAEPRPWYREPMLWLVILLPAAAVIASFASLYFAVHGADRLVQDPPPTAAPAAHGHGPG